MKQNVCGTRVISTLGASVLLAALTGPVAGQTQGTDPVAATKKQGTDPVAATKAQGTEPVAATKTQGKKPVATTIETLVVTVTATGRDEKLSDVPSSIQAFSGEQLETAGIRDLSEIFKHIPGASAGRALSAGSRSFQMRGVSSFTGDSTVGYYLDEIMFVIPNRNFAPVVSAFDVERVEVQRGPQGTLYGLSAMGGTIRFITADPDLKQVKARANLGYSWTRDGKPNYMADAALSVPLSENVAGIRASATFSKQGGYASSPTFPNRSNTTELQNFRLKFLAKPDRDWTVKLGYQYTYGSDPLGQQLANTANTSVSPNSFLPSVLVGQPIEAYNTMYYKMGTAFVAYDAGFASIESATGYIDRTPGGRIPLVVGPSIAILDTGGGSRTFSSELRAVSKGNSSVRWVAGTTYLNAQNKEDVLVRMARPGPPGPGGVIPVVMPRNSSSVLVSRSYALFGEVSTDLLEGRLTPLIGLRYFNDRRTNRDTNFNAVPALQNTGAAATFTSWNPRFNLAYKLTPETMTYLNIAKGFRSGTFNPQSALSFAAVPISAAVAPDQVLSYEVGSKSLFANRKVSLNLAAYRLDWTDNQLPFQTGVPLNATVIVNAGTVRGYGIDYGVDWTTPIQGLTLRVNGNRNRTYLASVDIPNASVLFANSNVVVGRQLAPVPTQTFTVAGTYFTLLPASDLALSVYGSYAFIGKQTDFGSVNEPRGAPAAAAPLGSTQNLLKLRLGVEGPNWAAFLVGENLLNRGNAFMISGSGSQRNYPRTVGLELRFTH